MRQPVVIKSVGSSAALIKLSIFPAGFKGMTDMRWRKHWCSVYADHQVVNKYLEQLKWCLPHHLYLTQPQAGTMWNHLHKLFPFASFLIKWERCKQWRWRLWECMPKHVHYQIWAENNKCRRRADDIKVEHRTVSLHKLNRRLWVY